MFSTSDFPLLDEWRVWRSLRQSFRHQEKCRPKQTQPGHTGGLVPRLHWLFWCGFPLLLACYSLQSWTWGAGWGVSRTHLWNGTVRHCSLWWWDVVLTWSFCPVRPLSGWVLSQILSNFGILSPFQRSLPWFSTALNTIIIIQLVMCLSI